MATSDRRSRRTTTRGEPPEFDPSRTPTRRIRKPTAASGASGVAAGLTHFDAGGAARMVEVGEKPETSRVAVASGRISMERATAAAIAAGTIGKGDVLAVARLAAIGGAKRASDLIPLCHPLRLTGVDVELSVHERHVAIRASVRAVDRSGVEMEALAAVTAAALTIYDMCKAIDRGMVLSEIRLEEKSGGASGRWQRTPQSP